MWNVHGAARLGANEVNEKTVPRRCDNCPIVNTPTHASKEHTSSHAYTDPHYPNTNPLTHNWELNMSEHRVLHTSLHLKIYGNGQQREWIESERAKEQTGRNMGHLIPI